MKYDLANAAPALPLYLKDKETVAAWACGKCHYVKASEQDARECCAAKLCDCGNPVKQHYVCCPECQAKNEAEREAKRIANAKRVPESQVDYLYCDCCEKFFGDSADLLEDHDDRERPLPDFAIPCYSRRLSLDAESILQNECENQEHHEDAFDSISDVGIETLQKLMDEWCEASAPVSFFPEYGEVVDLAEAKAAFLREKSLSFRRAEGEK